MKTVITYVLIGVSLIFNFVYSVLLEEKMAEIESLNNTVEQVV